jgi:hypothetical protein
LVERSRFTPSTPTVVDAETVVTPAVLLLSVTEQEPVCDQDAARLGDPAPPSGEDALQHRARNHGKPRTNSACWVIRA